ncbi:MAG: hypothetical protein A3J55_00625 [Candidatus Ryanbacteria bacterium RIFCSPHIGHO2_02_FULL_45_17b]|uniref:Uncharacterized protein n=1 Tax=Candidatus Ryanbacteria bacterium RIFCSPHIGHO2_01_FULL_45_22 TaxID=1802114 RepID=A0A1G2G1Q8_9BACT|nr:MAG: hypothetical protein A2719_03090 [Candidatus Ryanbacteria bacterium RIFCSPHIGHO2_01_FULL_45_22]OGZ47047.1 MAG: hypothetical protein A3J55_00625 [Candidatus Ryanbacteria bacterium RIFCSPHIGHO2_02_FULL_45_17b]
MLKKETKSNRTKAAPRATNPDIFRFIDFFVRTGEKMIGKKPTIIRGKDGKLVSYALRRLPVGKLETLTVWFLARKKNLQPLIGTMLSTRVLDELTREMDKSSFWKEIDTLMDQYYPRKETVSMWKPFTHADITSMKEEVARIMRKF